MFKNLFSRTRAFSRNDWGMVAMTTVLVVAACGLWAGIIYFLTPQKYISTCVFEPRALPGATITAADPNTVCQVLVGSVALHRVSESLRLTNQLNMDMEQAVAVLKRQTTAKVLPGGRLVEVKVKFKSPAMARDIVHTIVREWGEHARQTARNEYDRRIKEAESKAAVHEGNAAELTSRMAAMSAAAVPPREEMADLEARRDKEAGTAAALRNEQFRLNAMRENPETVLVVHDSMRSDLPLPKETDTFTRYWLAISLPLGVLMGTGLALLRMEVRSRPRTGAVVPMEPA